MYLATILPIYQAAGIDLRYPGELRPSLDRLARRAGFAWFSPEIADLLQQLGSESPSPGYLLLPPSGGSQPD